MILPAVTRRSGSLKTVLRTLSFCHCGFNKILKKTSGSISLEGFSPIPICIVKIKSKKHSLFLILDI